MEEPSAAWLVCRTVDLPSSLGTAPQALICDADVIALVADLVHP
jgi:hypothetical protein